MTKEHSGITLLETLIVAIIISLIISGIIAFFAMLDVHIKKTMDKHNAITLIISQVEDLKEISKKDFDDARLSDTEGLPPHDSTITIPGGFSITYEIEDSYDWPEDGVQGAPAPPLEDDTVDYKKITVSCIYDTDKQVQFKTYVIKI